LSDIAGEIQPLFFKLLFGWQLGFTMVMTERERADWLYCFCRRDACRISVHSVWWAALNTYTRTEPIRAAPSPGAYQSTTNYRLKWKCSSQRKETTSRLSHDTGQDRTAAPPSPHKRWTGCSHSCSQQWSTLRYSTVQEKRTLLHIPRK
jgi:hypothetical protein